jgi:hypothetical protein
MMRPLWDGLPTPEGKGRALHWILRMSVVACFVGHGAFGFITKADWLPFFATFRIGPDVAYRIMPLVGAMDVALGVMALVRPCGALLGWMTFWGLFTALLRPMSGFSFFETLERAGNYGVPFAFLLLAREAGVRGWLQRIPVVPITPPMARHQAALLAASTAALLVGHGAFGLLLVKPMLVAHLAHVGLGSPDVLRLQGALEVGMGLLVSFVTAPLAMWGIAAWKLATEWLYVLHGSPVFEVVERGGSYGAPLALGLLLREPRRAEAASRPESTAAAA